MAFRGGVLDTSASDGTKNNYMSARPKIRRKKSSEKKVSPNSGAQSLQPFTVQKQKKVADEGANRERKLILYGSPSLMKIRL